jgi:putative flippase GtrA
LSRFLRFCVAGTIGFLVDAGVLQLLARGLGIDPYLARVGSFLAAATATWWINRRYTFEVAGAASRSEWGAYVGLMVLGAAVNYGAYAACITWWPLAREHLWLGVAVGSIAGLGINFATSRALLSGKAG